MSRKITMLVEVDCDEDILPPDDSESAQWFVEQVLRHPTDDGDLYLHSNEIGATVGRVRVLEVDCEAIAVVANESCKAKEDTP